MCQKSFLNLARLIFLVVILLQLSLQQVLSVSDLTTWANPNHRTDVDTPIKRKVISVVFNPILEHKNGVRVNQYFGWKDPKILEQTYINNLKDISAGVVDYEIVSRLDNLDYFPTKSDGFIYNDLTYLDVMEGRAPGHSPDIINYQKLINDLKLCDGRNNDQFHEVWLWGGPYFGFYESTMAGPNSFVVNSPPVTNTTCAKQLYVMGYSYERGVTEMAHNLGHRTESIMRHLFGSWKQNSTNHLWEQFALNNHLSPNYNYSGCGNTHFPPNGIADYDYWNYNNTSSTCNNWYQFPNLTNQKSNINCTAWDCNQINQPGKYEFWWLAHLPKYQGLSNNKWSNWWKYILDYENAIKHIQPPPAPSNTQPNCTISGDANETMTAGQTKSWTFTCTDAENDLNSAGAYFQKQPINVASGWEQVYWTGNRAPGTTSTIQFSDSNGSYTCPNNSNGEKYEIVLGAKDNGLHTGTILGCSGNPAGTTTRCASGKDKKIVTCNPPAQIPTATIAASCTLNQTLGNLSYDLSLTNINPSSVFNQLDFQMCLYPQSNSNHKYVFENFFGSNATWRASDGSWQCYRIGEQITQPSGNSLSYQFDKSKKIGGSATWSKTIDQMAAFVDQAIQNGNMTDNPLFPLKAVLTVNEKTNDQLFAGDKKIQSNACITLTPTLPLSTSIFSDTNNDDKVDILDILNHIKNFGKTLAQGIDPLDTNINNDEQVNIFDYVFSLRDFGLSQLSYPGPETGNHIRARGTPVDDIYPTFQLLNRFNHVILEQAVTENWTDYPFTLTLKDTIMTGYKIKFVNDKGDRNLQIDYLYLHGQKLETEADTTYSTGTWNSTDSACIPGYVQSEYLHCNGYVEYNSSTPT